MCRNCIDQEKREEEKKKWFCILWGQNPSLSFHLVVPCCSGVLRECFSSWPVLMLRPHQPECPRGNQAVAGGQALLTHPFHLVCPLHQLWCGKAIAVNIISVTWHQKYPTWKIRAIMSTYTDTGCDEKFKYVKCYQARGNRPLVTMCLFGTLIRKHKLSLLLFYNRKPLYAVSASMTCLQVHYANRCVCSLSCLLAVCLGCAFTEMITTFLHWIWVRVPLQHSGCKTLRRQPEANSSVSSFCLLKNIKHLNQWAFISYLIFYCSTSPSYCTASQIGIHTAVLVSLFIFFPLGL